MTTAGTPLDADEGSALNTASIPADVLPDAPPQPSLWQRTAALLRRTARQLWALVTSLSFWLTLGVAARLLQYFSTETLALEEAALVNNILARSLGDLFGVLNDFQTAPAGWLVVMKLMTGVLGTSEPALRLFPVLLSLASVPLFLLFLRQFVRGGALTLGMALFAIDTALLTYATEATPRSADVLMTILILLAACALWREPHTIGRALAFGVVGVVGVWFSHPAIFVWVGAAAALLVRAVVQRRLLAAAVTLAAAFVWALGFGILYVVQLHHVVGAPGLLQFWRGSFLPFPPVNIDQVSWYVDTLLGVFSNEQGLFLTDVAAFVFFVGWVALVVRRQPLSLFVAPLLALLVASALGVYPLTSYLLVFLTPLLLVVIAAGVEYLLEQTAALEFRALSAVVMVMLLMYPVYQFVSSPLDDGQNLRDVLRFYADNRQPGDMLYVYHYALPAVEYYADAYGIDLSSEQFFAGQSWVNATWAFQRPERSIPYTRDLFRMNGNERVWLLFANARTDEQAFTTFLNGIGERQRSYRASGAIIHLYDLQN